MACKSTFTTVDVPNYDYIKVMFFLFCWFNSFTIVCVRCRWVRFVQFFYIDLYDFHMLFHNLLYLLSTSYLLLLLHCFKFLFLFLFNLLCLYFCFDLYFCVLFPFCLQLFQLELELGNSLVLVIFVMVQRSFNLLSCKLSLE